MIASHVRLAAPAPSTLACHAARNAHDASCSWSTRQVTTVPEGFTVLASSPTTRIQLLAKDNQVLTFQVGGWCKWYTRQQALPTAHQPARAEPPALAAKL